jgi:endonuclease G
MSETDCPHCAAKKTTFDAEIAFRRLARRHQQLGALVRAALAAGAVTPEPATYRPFAAAAPLAGRAGSTSELRIIAERILGGVETDAFADCCLVGRRSPNGAIGWFCSGVLVHRRIVLTAGHCVDPIHAPNVVALRASSQNRLEDAELIDIRRVHVHPQYLQTRRLSDVTVAVLRADAQTPPVGIATSAELAAAPRTTLVGFGNTDPNSTKGFGLKRMVEVDIRSIRTSPNQDLDADEVRFGFESDLELVAGGSGFDSCNGDSGGPAYIEVNGSSKVAAVTSRATDDSTHKCGDGGIYTRLDKQTGFIREIASAAGIPDF